MSDELDDKEGKEQLSAEGRVGAARSRDTLDWSGFEAERAGLIGQDWQIFAGISMLCVAGLLMFHYSRYGMRGLGQQEFVVQLVAFGVIAGVTGFAFVLRQGLFFTMNPVVSTLGTTALRLLAVLFVVGLASATKWNNSNSFASVMLGCYFIFLLLESCLSVRWYSAWRRIVHNRRLPS